MKVLPTQSCLTLCDPMDCTHQPVLSMGFSRQEYWNGSPCPPPGDLPNPGIESEFPALQAAALPSEPPGKPQYQMKRLTKNQSQNTQAAPAAQFQKNKRDPIKKWAKELNRHFSKEDMQMVTNTWKDAQHHSLSEKCKSKPQWGTISSWSEWLLSKSL